MMTNTPAEFIAYCLAHPQDRDGSTWDQKCVALVFRAGGFSASADSAYRAALATEAAGHKLDTTTPLDKLPVGWFVYFDKAGPDNGHIGMTTGNGQFGSANWRAKGWGTALGLMGIQFYINTGARYMGASPYFINTTLDLSSTAGSGPTPLELDVPLTDLEMTTIANRAAEAVWHFMLAEPPEGVTPGKAQLAGDWLRYSDARLKMIPAATINGAPIDYAALAKAVNEDAAQRLAN